MFHLVYVGLIWFLVQSIIRVSFTVSIFGSVICLPSIAGVGTSCLMDTFFLCCIYCWFSVSFLSVKSKSANFYHVIFAVVSHPCPRLEGCLVARKVVLPRHTLNVPFQARDMWSIGKWLIFHSLYMLSMDKIYWIEFKLDRFCLFEGSLPIPISICLDFSGSFAMFESWTSYFWL